MTAPTATTTPITATELDTIQRLFSDHLVKKGLYARFGTMSIASFVTSHPGAAHQFFLTFPEPQRSQLIAIHARLTTPQEASRS